ncbi:hypothetical protein RUMOBE_00882 [Blautia obeum ATCC 29174]|jgi:hypothetical protein|uniref:Uncharacterized protein n=1 Tax=Blautia obeum ATCC 29174 TaxID=411459 RepID=A5ZPG6_9FIRM|nr:hypothetical protein RUMOBE_00882 [Blautia obeum ATCC 29174]
MKIKMNNKVRQQAWSKNIFRRNTIFPNKKTPAPG